MPFITDIHATVLAAATATNYSLNMGDWHTCETTHCRAGWVVFLAGKEGLALEKETSTLFAAMQIYKVSSDIKVPPARFFENNEQGLADMNRCADLEGK